MGLIKAGMGAVGGVLADQWKEFFYCDSMPPDVLMMKDRNGPAAAARTQAEKTTLFPTDPSLPSITGSA